MVDSLKPMGGPTSVQRAAAIPAATPTRASEIARAAAANVVPNPAADLAAWGPPINDDKIAALRDQIAAGTYKPDPAQIAAKMIESDVPAPQPEATKPATPEA